MANILITGGHSFISKSIIPYLKSKEHKILYFGHSELDVSNYNQLLIYLKSNYPDILIHCASEGGRRNNVENLPDLRSNLKMLENVLSLDMYYKKLIVFGSGAEFDINTNILNKDEDSKCLPPSDIYGLFKYVQTKRVRNNNKVLNLRLFNVFSEYGMYDSFIPTAIEQCVNNLPIKIFEDKLFSSFYGEDLAILIDYLINNNDGLYKEFNCVYRKSLKLSDIANLIKSNIGSKNDIIIEKNSSKNYHGCGDKLSKLHLKFNGLEKGIRKVIEDFNND